MGQDVLEFGPVPVPVAPLCLSVYCVAIDDRTLISGHDYYITIATTNSGALTSFVSSEAYTHVSGLPGTGVVMDTHPTTPTQAQDVDVLISVGAVGANWQGFPHPHLPVSYSVGLGTLPGSDDVVAMTTVGSEARSHVFEGVALEDGATYYTTVWAHNALGVSQASSDGVRVLLRLEDLLQLAAVYDGLSEVDIDRQLPTTTASAQWFFPAGITEVVSYYSWAVLQGGTTEAGSSLDEVTTFQSVGLQTSAVVAGLRLEAGERYVSAVRACLPTVCLPPVFSDGFSLAAPPTPSSAPYAVYTPLDWNVELGTSSYGVLHISWSPFQDPGIALYEWSLGTGTAGFKLLVNWNEVEWFETEVTVALNVTVSLHTPNTVAVRGFNSASLHAVTSAPLHWNVSGEILTQERVPRLPLTVVDIPSSQVPASPPASDWRQLEYEAGLEYEDLQYTASSSSLSAVWPNLRYTRYLFSVSTVPTFQTCDSAVGCGSTVSNAATATGLRLEDGQRYYFCVQALRSDAIHPRPDTPTSLSACSNGVTVDLTPPSGSCVEILSTSTTPSGSHDPSSGSHDLTSGGSGVSDVLPLSLRECRGNANGFVASSSELYVVWDSFRDLEQYGSTAHAGGVAYYQVAVGEWCPVCVCVCVCYSLVPALPS